MATYKIHEAKTHFSELVEKAMMGEDIVIAKGNRPVVRLTTLRPAKKRKVGSAKGQIEIAPDFDAPLADFAGY